MSQRPRRRNSMGTPPDFSQCPPDPSEVMDKLKDHSASFIREFAGIEHRMRQIAGEIEEIIAEVRKMQKKKRLAVRIGALILAGLVAATAVAVAVKAADGEARTATRTRSLTATATTKWTEAPIILAAAGRQVGLGVVGSLGIGPTILVVAALAVALALALVAATLTENRSIEKVEELGAEILEMVEPLKKDLEDIRRTSETLEQRPAGLQAGQTLRDMEDLQRTLGRGPAERREILMLSALCSSVVGDCEKMKEILRDVTDQ
ncbi:uncharacterized protein LOC116679513 [Etheostoma spectabile]|uniref:uncharacterized protein LOC116679513 n=1 Tax=Etheostoma spectabile TaxID=54343 RepID=UPI0013AF72DB|nr:uncharacterized protein LOC116679513 [Etheostoma spectabile]